MTGKNLIQLQECSPCRLRYIESYKGIARKREDYYSQNPIQQVKHHRDMLRDALKRKRIAERIAIEERTRNLTEREKQNITAQVEREFHDPYKLYIHLNPLDKREFLSAEISYGNFLVRYENLNPTRSMPLTPETDIYITFDHVVIKTYRKVFEGSPEQLANILNSHYAGFYGKAYVIGSSIQTVKGEFNDPKGNKTVKIESKYVGKQLLYTTTIRTQETCCETYKSEKPQRLRVAIMKRWKDMGYSGKLRYTINKHGEPVFTGGFKKHIKSNSSNNTPETLIVLLYYDPLQNRSKEIKGWSTDYMENYIEQAENNTGDFKPVIKSRSVRTYLQDEDKYKPEWKPKKLSEHNKTERLYRQYELQLADIDEIKRQQNELDYRKKLLYQQINK